MKRLLRVPYAVSLFLLVYMPFHIFLSVWLSTYTGQLDLWKIAKDLLLFAVSLLAVGLVYIQDGFKDRKFWKFLVFSAAYLVLHLLIWQLKPDIADKPALLATAYNGRLLDYAVLGWAAAILAKKYLDIRKVFRIVIIVSTVICFLGLAQYFLPKDFMAHFGYSLDRGVKPAFFIDDKPDLPRIMSTLRDPNSLGAYLILPISVLVGAWLRRPKDRVLFSGLLLLHAWALFLTFSRSAWVGTFLAAAIIFVWHFKDKTKGLVKRYWPLLAAAAVVLAAGIFLLRDQYWVQNVVFHSDENTRMTDSNNLHAQLAGQGIRGIYHEPLGHGPGTAGLVSIQTQSVVLTENYFIQIGYEVGVAGLLLLVILMAYVCKLLYERGDFYAHAMLAAFAGITFCCFLLHTWTNEAVACQWWLLAGILIGSKATNKGKNG